MVPRCTLIGGRAGSAWVPARALPGPPCRPVDHPHAAAPQPAQRGPEPGQAGQQAAFGLAEELIAPRDQRLQRPVPTTQNRSSFSICRPSRVCAGVGLAP